MYSVTDVIDQELKVDDFVVFYSNIYRVNGVGTTKQLNGSGQVRIKLINAGKTNKSVVKNSKDIAKLDQQLVLMWMLKKGYQ